MEWVQGCTGFSFELHGKAAKPRRHSPTLVTLSPHPLAALFWGGRGGGVERKMAGFLVERARASMQPIQHTTLSMKLTIFDTVTDRPDDVPGLVMQLKSLDTSRSS